MIPASFAVITTEDKSAMRSVVDSGWLTAGGVNRSFEKALGDFTGIPYVRTCNSGSSANLLAVAALVESGVWKRGDEVITAATSFPTTVNPLLLYGLVPVFCDIDIPTYNVSVESVTKAMSEKTKGIMLAHTLGNPFDPKIRWYQQGQKGAGLHIIEDCCFAGGTKIRVFRAEKNIEDIRRGDVVLTRQGYKRVLEAKMTGRKKVMTDLGMAATPDHPFITKCGVKRLYTLSASDILYTWNEKLSCIEEKSIGAIRIQRSVTAGSISGIIQSLFQNLFTGRFGSTILEIFPKDFMSTIGTIIRSTTNQTTSNFFLQSSILQNIEQKNEWRNYTATSTLQDSKLQNGINLKKEKNSTNELELILGIISQLIRKYVKYVGKAIKHIFRQDQKTALESARLRVEVYNLKIEEVNEFFANGILVHNCDALGSTYTDIDGTEYHVGTQCSFSTCSFFPAHHITCGEGGAIFTDVPEFAKVAESIRDWGRDCYCEPGKENTCGKRFDQQFGELPYGYDHKYTYTRLGYNLKLTEVQAACGLSQIARLRDFVAARRSNWAFLRRRLDGLQQHIILPEPTVGTSPSWFGFAITIKYPGQRTALQQYLDSCGIGSRLLFAGNITKQPYMAGRNFRISGNLENSDKVMNDGVWIGCHPHLTEEQLEFMCQKIEGFFC